MQITELEVVARDDKFTRSELRNAQHAGRATAPHPDRPRSATAVPGPGRCSPRARGGASAPRSCSPAVLAFMGLGNHAFWDDEANTALFARNLLDHGALTAWDGTNVAASARGAELDERLVNVLHAAACSNTGGAAWRYRLDTVGGRVVFVLMGLAALGRLGLWARWHLGRAVPAWLPAMRWRSAPPTDVHPPVRYYARRPANSVLLATAAYPA